MKYFAAILHRKDASIRQKYRPRHLAYLEKLERAGKIHMRGPFADGAGGLVVYKVETFEEAKQMTANDPYIERGARRLELHEWLIDCAEWTRLFEKRAKADFLNNLFLLIANGNGDHLSVRRRL